MDGQADEKQRFQRERDVCGGGWRTKTGTFEKNKRAAKKNNNSNKETILCAILETCESVRHGFDVQTGKRLMKECIDRCVDSCGSSELSRSHSDRVFKRNNRRLMKFGCSGENGMPSVTGCSAGERESVKRLMHKWKDKSGRASKSPADNVTLV